MAESNIVAMRNGVSREFTKAQWDAIGTDKYGWVAIPQTPKEVASIRSLDQVDSVLSIEPNQVLIKEKKPRKPRQK